MVLTAHSGRRLSAGGRKTIGGGGERKVKEGKNIDRFDLVQVFIYLYIYI